MVKPLFLPVCKRLKHSRWQAREPDQAGMHVRSSLWNYFRDNSLDNESKRKRTGSRPAPARGKRNNGAGEHQMQKKAPVDETRRKFGEARGWLSARLKHLAYVGGCLPFLSPCPHVRRGPVHPPGRGKLKPALPTRAKRNRNEDDGTKKQRAWGLG